MQDHAGQDVPGGWLRRRSRFQQGAGLFVESAKLNPARYVLLGQMAERGEGEPVDYVKARDLYRRSGKNAVLQLGRLMEAGEGEPHKAL